MLKGDFARRSPWYWRLVAILLPGLVATVVSAVMPVMGGALLLICFALATWQGAVWLFNSSGLFISPVVKPHITRPLLFFVIILPT